MAGYSPKENYSTEMRMSFFAKLEGKWQANNTK